ncbi:hypothetical protein FJZ17_00920 [Candidatus Pacearchaeota archaeon]|nr:hypothetical protein [Candidatus Pacearchaeota archaeon]
MNKKEGRLSPTARKILSDIRTKFSHSQIKAREYLLSINPRELTPYDRLKLSREIKVRYKDASSSSKGKYKKSWRTSDSWQDYNPETLSTAAEDAYGAGEWNLKQKEALANAGGCFERAGQLYEDAGNLERARFSYDRALLYLRRADKQGIWGEDEQSKKEVIEHLISSIKRIQKKQRVTKRGLEKVAATASIIGVLGGIFFLSSNITGNAIADLTTKTTSFLGAGLLIVGLVAGFFYIKDKKK